MILAAGAMILLPLAMTLLLLWPPLRPVIIRGLGLAPLPALLLLPAAWQSGRTTLLLPGSWCLVVDQPGALMLAASALLWIIGGVAAQRWLAGRQGQGRFALWWLLTLSGNLGVFVAGDVVSFYALYALASLPAYGLITFGGGTVAARAGSITLAAALIGESLILAAFALLVAGAPGQGLAIAAVLQGLPAIPAAGLVVTLLILGFGFKIGLVPLHGWMPISYAAGPLVATAVLSGATSKAGLIGLIRFLPLDGAMPMPVAGTLLLAAGLVAGIHGALLGLTQANPRSVLAYSSISQLGQMAAVLGAALAAGLPGAGLLVAYYACYHVLTKGGLFLLLGAGGGDLTRWQARLAGFSALGFAGLPLTGGGLGKLAIKEVVGGGATGLLFSLAAIGSTVLMLHFLRLLRRAAGPADAQLPAAAWVAAVVAAILLQWVLFTAVTRASAVAALTPASLADLAWPVAVGGLIGWGLAAAGTQLPRLQPGDFGARIITVAGQLAWHLASVGSSVEAWMRRWPASTLALTVVLILLVVLQARGAAH